MNDMLGGEIKTGRLDRLSRLTCATQPGEMIIQLRSRRIVNRPINAPAAEQCLVSRVNNGINFLKDDALLHYLYSCHAIPLIFLNFTLSLPNNQPGNPN
jgi:hypothetical protein